MRRLLFAVGLVGLLTLGTSAQEAKKLLPQEKALEGFKPPKQMTAKDAEYLERILKNWEMKMTEVKSLTSQVRLVETSANGQAEALLGEASLLRPGMAQIMLKDMADDKNDKRWRHYLLDDKQQFWDFNYRTKQALAMNMKQAKNADQTVLDFLFGIKAKDFLTRFECYFDSSKEGGMWDENYFHIDIYPKKAADMQEFGKARLVLWRSNDPKFKDLEFMPRQLWFQNINKSQVEWNFSKMSIKANLTEKDFTARFPGKDWKADWMKAPDEPVKPVSNKDKK